MRGSGRIFKRKNSSVWWIAYCHRGKEIRESTANAVKEAAKRKRGRLTDEDVRKAAENLLKRRLQEIGADRLGLKAFIGPQQDRLTVGEMLDALEADFRLREIKSLRQTVGHLKVVREMLGDIRAVEVSTQTATKYIDRRLAVGRKPGTVNRETALLNEAFRLAVRRHQLSAAPEIPRLRENNVRQGFFSVQQFKAVCEELPQYLRGFCQFAYRSGWRKGEVASLQWADVDMLERVVRLRPEHSKNGQGRSLMLDGELWNVIETAWKIRQFKNPDGTTGLSLCVFHRKGRPIASFRKSWAAACKSAEVEGRLFHDLRRSAVRNMVRAGVPERVAMAISGHKTRAIFDRYNIVSEDDLRNAVQRTEAYLNNAPSLPTVVSIQEAKTDVKKEARQ